MNGAPYSIETVCPPEEGLVDFQVLSRKDCFPRKLKLMIEQNSVVKM